MVKRPKSIGVLFIVIVSLIVLCTSSALAGEKIMNVEQIKSGMQGIGKTVVEGTKIVSFPVKVLGVVPGHGGKGDLILIRVGGEIIQQTGGIAEGMSGSPVYIDGKLIGAIGYGWQMADHNIGLVTPIRDMLKVLDMQEKQKASLDGPVAIDGKLAGQKGTILLKPLATPLLVNGIQGRAFEQLKSKLAPFNLQVIQGAAQGNSSNQAGSLAPGSALGVQLMEGYVEAGAIGTVTYVDKGRILAFGHPFLNKGLVNFPLTTAYIHQTIPSLLAPFKLGSTGTVVGRITQDRTAGIAGEIGKKTPLTLVRMIVTDKDLGRTERMYFNVIKDRDLAGALTTSGLLSMLDSSLDRLGKGSAKVSFEFKGVGLPNNSFQRENVFYSPTDISAMSLTEVAEALDMVTNNTYKNVDLQELVVRVEVEEKEKVAYLQKAVAKTPKVSPGQRAEIEVTYIPFRGQPVVSVVKVKIPEDMPKGMLNLAVTGGSLPLYALGGAGQAEGAENNPGAALAAALTPPFNSLEEMLDNFLKQNKNNEIVVEEMPGLEKVDNAARTSAKGPEQGKALELSNENQERPELNKVNLLSKEEPSKIKTVFATPYVLSGYCPVTLEVVEKVEKK